MNSFLAGDENRLSTLAGVKRLMNREQYPKNLYKDVYGEEFDRPVTEDILKGADAAVESLPETLREIVKLYYIDHKTQKEISEIVGISSDSVRYYREKGVRMLRHPKRSALIKWGLIGGMDELWRRIETLETRVEILEKIEQPERAPEGAGEESWDIPLLKAGFSVRTFNCLMRRGCSTLEAVAELAEKGGLIGIRNFNKKCIIEVLEKLKTLTGRDYSDIYKEYLQETNNDRN